jgi:hypothetical protein
MIKKTLKYDYKCDHCGYTETFYNEYQGRNHLEIARVKGWGISRDRAHCFCPNCAVYYRNAGKKNMLVAAEIKGLRKGI